MIGNFVLSLNSSNQMKTQFLQKAPILITYSFQTNLFQEKMIIMIYNKIDFLSPDY